jgi:hypothetical protein
VQTSETIYLKKARESSSVPRFFWPEEKRGERDEYFTSMQQRIHRNSASGKFSFVFLRDVRDYAQFLPRLEETKTARY